MDLSCTNPGANGLATWIDVFFPQRFRFRAFHHFGRLGSRLPILASTTGEWELFQSSAPRGCEHPVDPVCFDDASGRMQYNAIHRDPHTEPQEVRLGPPGAYISLQSPYLRRYDWIPKKGISVPDALVAASIGFTIMASILEN